MPYEINLDHNKNKLKIKILYDIDERGYVTDRRKSKDEDGNKLVDVKGTSLGKFQQVIED